MYAVTVDPWKCSGCLECIEVCGPGSLVEREQTPELLETMQAGFEFLNQAPGTPASFYEGATGEGGKTARLMLDPENYYCVTGGHGACRGCGEVTAIRMVLAANRAIHSERNKAHTAELEALIERLSAKRGQVSDTGRADRIGKTLQTLERRLYELESGPTGKGPSSAVIANSTGCSSVYASTFPFNPYTDPWVNSLFQDAQPLAKGIFEGISATAVEDFRAIRTAKLELEDGYKPEHDAFFKYFNWTQLTDDELGLLPTVLTIGGDGATYDIGFGALSRVLASNTPVKIVVLNTGAYSNTGGQASTASLTAQDSDLSRVGAAHAGKEEDRKELGLIASFHPNVFVAQCNTAVQGTFFNAVLEFLNYKDGPAVLDIYTPCQPEHGISDNSSRRQGKAACDSRMSPTFLRDPRLGEFLSLDGNPAKDKDWTNVTISYVDEAGAKQRVQVPFTPADFAFSEGRFKKHFKKLPEGANNGVPIHEYLGMSAAAREGKTPYVLTTDAKDRLVKMAVAPAMVKLTQERRRNWRMLQFLAGQQIEAMDASHRAEMDAMKAKLAEAAGQRETTLDSIAQAMAELAASSGAPVSAGFGGAAFAANGAGSAPAKGPAAANGSKPLVTFADDRIADCTNCKTCYQELSELFEKTSITVEGASKDVGHLIPGILERTTITDDLRKRVARVSANCEAEIIR